MKQEKKSPFDEDELVTLYEYSNALKQRQEELCNVCYVHVRLLDWLIQSQIELRKLKKKGYEFQKLRDELHAKEVELEKVKRQRDGWRKDCAMAIEEIMKLKKVV